jgi:hypothetical protein
LQSVTVASALEALLKCLAPRDFPIGLWLAVFSRWPGVIAGNAWGYC